MINVDPNLSEAQPISRYMSLAKFLDLVTRKRLYFAAIANLGDRHEGSSTLINSLVDTGLIDMLETVMNYDMPAAMGINISSEDRTRLKKESEARHAKKKILNTPFGDFDVTESGRYKALMLGQRSWLDVSCWHKNQDESLAMWKIYGGDTESLCIISTVQALASSLRPDDDVTIFISPVHYIDHQNEYFQSNNLYGPAVHKQKPYAYEQEIRAIATRVATDILLARTESGSYIDVDPVVLINSIRLSPRAPRWFRELIEREISPLEIPIYQSELDRDPIFGD